MNLLTNPFAPPLVPNAQQLSQVHNNQSLINMYAKQDSSSIQDQDKNIETCINKICKKYKPNKRSLANDPQKLCKKCLLQYNKQNYCLYCKQIYFQESDDGKQWILCQQCSRWVHSQCANYDPTNDIAFMCIKCRKNQQVLNRNSSNTDKKVSKVSKFQRRKVNQCSLNAFGFYWELAPSQLAQDMNKIKQFLK